MIEITPDNSHLIFFRVLVSFLNFSLYSFHRYSFYFHWNVSYNDRMFLTYFYTLILNFWYTPRRRWIFVKKATLDLRWIICMAWRIFLVVYTYNKYAKILLNVLMCVVHMTYTKFRVFFWNKWKTVKNLSPCVNILVVALRDNFSKTVRKKYVHDSEEIFFFRYTQSWHH